MGKVFTWSEAQKRAVTRHLRNGARDRKSIATLLATFPEPKPSLSLLKKYVSERKARAPPKPERLSDKEVVEHYVSLREDKAMLGDHSRVTSVEVADKVQEEHGFETKFKTRSRMQRATLNRPDLRDPTKDPTYGDRAALSQRITDLKHHNR